VADEVSLLLLHQRRYDDEPYRRCT